MSSHWWWECGSVGECIGRLVLRQQKLHARPGFLQGFTEANPWESINSQVATATWDLSLKQKNPRLYPDPYLTEIHIYKGFYSIPLTKIQWVKFSNQIMEKESCDAVALTYRTCGMRNTFKNKDSTKLIYWSEMDDFSVHENDTLQRKYYKSQHQQ